MLHWPNGTLGLIAQNGRLLIAVLCYFAVALARFKVPFIILGLRHVYSTPARPWGG